MKRLILIAICLTCLPGCTAFRALFNVSNETGRIRELAEKKDVREELVFGKEHSEMLPEYHRRIGLIVKSDQIDADKDWLSNPNSKFGAIATLGGLVHPFIGLGSMGGIGGIVMTMLIGYLRRKKELKVLDKKQEQDNRYKDKVHELEKRELKIGTVAEVPAGTLRGTRSLRLSLAADVGMKFYEDDTGRTYRFVGTNWEQV